MKDRYPDKRDSLLVPGLVFSCCAMIVLLILVHFAWQMRYQELSRELTRQKSPAVICQTTSTVQEGVFRGIWGYEK